MTIWEWYDNCKVSLYLMGMKSGMTLGIMRMTWGWPSLLVSAYVVCERLSVMQWLAPVGWLCVKNSMSAPTQVYQELWSGVTHSPPPYHLAVLLTLLEIILWTLKEFWPWPRDHVTSQINKSMVRWKLDYYFFQSIGNNGWKTWAILWNDEFWKHRVWFLL